MNYTYVYLVGSLILLFFWLLVYFLRKDLRNEIWFGSLLALPFGFTEFLFVPEYWTPPSLFDLIHKIGFGIESFIFAFACGGLASVIYEVVENKKLVKNYRKLKYAHHFAFILMAILFIVLEIIIPAKPIFNLDIAILSSATFICFVRRDLVPHTILSGLFFTVFYYFFGLTILFLYPGFVTHVYNLKNLSGFIITGIPIEELMFAFSVGAGWSVSYGYLKNLRDI